MAECSLIIVSYNSSKIITNCLAPVIDCGKFPVTIVDNASSDNGVETLGTRFPNAEIIALPQNIGYGRAANVGLEKTATPYAMLLNPDLMATPKAIERLLDYAENAADDVAILAPAVKKKHFSDAAPESVAWISGAAMLFDMDKLSKIGRFDENIFLFSEESDLCLRTVNAGYKIMRCHDIHLDHLKGKSSVPSPEMEYMKNWHFGWSHAYYNTKHNQAAGKQAPLRMYLAYRCKSFFSPDPRKRIKYKARAIGTKAFMDGIKAFDADGHPFHGANSAH